MCKNISPCLVRKGHDDKSGILYMTGSGCIEWEERDNRSYVVDSRLGEAHQEPEIRRTCTLYYRLSKASYDFLPVAITEGCLYSYTT